MTTQDDTGTLGSSIFYGKDGKPVYDSGDQSGVDDFNEWINSNPYEGQQDPHYGDPDYDDIGEDTVTEDPVMKGNEEDDL